MKTVVNEPKIINNKSWKSEFVLWWASWCTNRFSHFLYV